MAKTVVPGGPAAKKASPAQKGPRPVVVPAPAVPPGTAPATPQDFAALGKLEIERLRKAVGVQATTAAAVATEIEASQTYTADFGGKAVPAAALGALMQKAAVWAAERTRARRWSLYVRDESAAAWDALIGATEGFKSDYHTGVGHDATIVERYPALNAFLSARTAAGQRGAATKKANKAAKAQAASAAAAPVVAGPPAPAGAAKPLQ